MLPSLLALCVLASAPTTAGHAQALDRGCTGIRAEFGFGTSSGMMGVAGWYDVAPRLRVEGGAGVGLSGLQLSGLLKLVAGGEFHRFTPGVGLSVGIPIGGWSAFMSRHDGPAIVMPWLNLQLLAYEYMSERGWTFTVEAGATTPLRHSHWDAVELGEDIEPLGAWFPGAHVGFGKSF